MKKNLLSIILFALILSVSANSIKAIDIDIVPAININLTKDKQLSAEATIYSDFLLENLYIGFSGLIGKQKFRRAQLAEQDSIKNLVGDSAKLTDFLIGLSFKYDYYFNNNTNIYYRFFILVPSSNTGYEKVDTTTALDATVNRVIVSLKTEHMLGLEVGYAYGNLGLALNFTNNTFKNKFTRTITEQTTTEPIDTTVPRVSIEPIEYDKTRKYATQAVGIKLFYLFNLHTKKKI